MSWLWYDGEEHMAATSKIEHRPLPEMSALANLTLLNSSRPFDDGAAIRHLDAIEDEMTKADEAMIEKLLGLR
jgi:hypothetical protein